MITEHDLTAYRPRAVRVARRLLGPEDAEDAVQNAYVLAWRHRAAFEGRCAPSTWLYRIVWQEALRQIRSARRRARRVVIGPLTEIVVETAPAPAEPESAWDDSTQAGWEALPARERALLALAADLNDDEVAYVLDLPLGTVKSAAHRAQRRMRAARAAA